MSPLRRTPMRRLTPLRPVSPRKRLAQAAERKFKAQVRDRDVLTCQGCGKGPAEARNDGLRLEVHHRLPKGRGGKDSPENGVVLCGFGNDPRGCHGKVDQQRAWAQARGLSIPSGVQPAGVPLMDWADRWWRLLPDGQRTRIEEAA